MRGYETDQGYWQDPPNYVENILYPAFLKYHDIDSILHPERNIIQILPEHPQEVILESAVKAIHQHLSTKHQTYPRDRDEANINANSTIS